MQSDDPERGGGEQRETVHIEPQPPQIRPLTPAEAIAQRRSQQTLTTIAIAMAGVFILVLIGQPVWRFLVPERDQTSPASDARAAAAYPPNGTIHRHSLSDSTLERGLLTFTGPGGEDLVVVRIRTWDSRDAIATIFMTADSVTQIRLTPGRYRVGAAYGTRWGGAQNLFGADTVVEEIASPITITAQTVSEVVLAKGPLGSPPTRSIGRSEF